MEQTAEEKIEVLKHECNIEKRKLMIQVKDWKTAYESLSNWIRKNFNDTNLTDVNSKINELRPGRY